MIIPDVVRILGHDYSIIYDKNIFLTDNTGGGKVCANTLEIALYPDSPESRLAEIFMHEIMESLKYCMQLTIEHEDLSALSEGLFSVIRNNDLDFRGVE